MRCSSYEAINEVYGNPLLTPFVEEVVSATKQAMLAERSERAALGRCQVCVPASNLSPQGGETFITELGEGRER